MVRHGSLRLSLEQEVGPSTDILLPRDGFEVGISCVAKIGYSQMWKYLIEEVEFKKQLSVEKPIVKRYNFFKSGKVLGLFSKTENGLFYGKKPSVTFIFKDWASICCKNHYMCKL